MTEGNQILEMILQKLIEAVNPGVTPLQIESLAVKLMKQNRVEPAFTKVKNYRWATCINVNQGVVHGIPSDYRIQPEDLLKIDTGIVYCGWNLDAAWSVIVENKNKRMAKGWQEKIRFLQAGERALKNAIQAAQPGNRIGHISQAIERTIREAGYWPVKELTGHAVGRKLHEEPMIPLILRGRIADTPKIESGMALAIEIIYTLKETGLSLKSDGWTIETANGCLAGLFEKTVLIN